MAANTTTSTGHGRDKNINNCHDDTESSDEDGREYTDNKTCPGAPRHKRRTETQNAMRALLVESDEESIHEETEYFPTSPGGTVHIGSSDILLARSAYHQSPRTQSSKGKAKDDDPKDDDPKDDDPEYKPPNSSTNKRKRGAKGKARAATGTDTPRNPDGTLHKSALKDEFVTENTELHATVKKREDQLAAGKLQHAATVQKLEDKLAAGKLRIRAYGAMTPEAPALPITRVECHHVHSMDLPDDEPTPPAVVLENCGHGLCTNCAVVWILAVEDYQKRRYPEGPHIRDNLVAFVENNPDHWSTQLFSIVIAQNEHAYKPSVDFLNTQRYESSDGTMLSHDLAFNICMGVNHDEKYLFHKVWCICCQEHKSIDLPKTLAVQSPTTPFAKLALLNQCQHCNASGFRTGELEDHTEQCGLNTVPCQYGCGYERVKLNVAIHETRDCSRRPCTHASAGCRSTGDHPCVWATFALGIPGNPHVPCPNTTQSASFDAARENFIQKWRERHPEVDYLTPAIREEILEEFAQERETVLTTLRNANVLGTLQSIIPELLVDGWFLADNPYHDHRRILWLIRYAATEIGHMSNDIRDDLFN